jgi:uncharacterized protein (UPF0332 family)
MTADEARRQYVSYLLDSAAQALASARSEHAAGRDRFAMNRAYYACFYAASAVLLNEGRHFVKHAGVRTCVHSHLVNTGRIPAALGKLYDEAFDDRHEADHGEFVQFGPSVVQARIEAAAQFVAAMRRLFGR